ncbi:MAG: hypothetical protein GX444_20075 [Myxococcales bacterium]|nr:hypothetical protein [Myxococcales bacterium]
MIRPQTRILLWFALAIWFAAGIGGLTTPLERETYAQVRALARFSVEPTAADLLPATPGGLPPAFRQRPGAALAALPFYWAGRIIGAIFADNPADPFGFTAQITALAAPIAAATALLLVGLSGLLIGLRPRPAVLAVLLIAVASPLTVYASRLAPPVFGLLAMGLTIYPLLRLTVQDDRLVLRLMLGAGLGLMPLLDDPFLLIWPLFLLWVLTRVRRILHRPSYALAFLLPLTLGVAAFLLINTAAWGGPLNAPDGLPLWRHFRFEYYSPAVSTETFLFKYLLRGLGFWLFNAGRISETLILTRALPETLRTLPFYGVFGWFPPLFFGILGAFVMRGDSEAKYPLRLFGLFFWLAVGLRAVARNFLDPAQLDAGATLPFWFPYLIGLAFFLGYHLWDMKGQLWKNVLRVLFVVALLASFGNAWYEGAAVHLAAKPRVMSDLLPLPPPQPPLELGDAASPAVWFPASSRDAFFLRLDQTMDWLYRDSLGFFAAFRPGVNNLAIFINLLLVLGAVLFFLDRITHWIAMRHQPAYTPDEEEPSETTPPDENEPAADSEDIPIGDE